MAETVPTCGFRKQRGWVVGKREDERGRSRARAMGRQRARARASRHAGARRDKTNPTARHPPLIARGCSWRACAGGREDARARARERERERATRFGSSGTLRHRRKKSNSKAGRTPQRTLLAQSRTNFIGVCCVCVFVCVRARERGAYGALQAEFEVPPRPVLSLPPKQTQNQPSPSQSNEVLIAHARPPLFAPLQQPERPLRSPITFSRHNSPPTTTTTTTTTTSSSRPSASSSNPPSRAALPLRAGHHAEDP
jgi:hypothetical protein